MARLVFPDEGSRLAYRMTGSGKPLLSAASGTATIYADAAGTTLADIQTEQGVTILSSTLTITAASQLPLFLGPDGVDTVWCSVDGGPLSPVYARNDDRLDALATTVQGLDTGGAVKAVNGILPDVAGNVVIASGAVTDATASAKGVVQLGTHVGGTATALTTPSALHITGAETANGVKTFNDGIVVPDGTFTVAKTTGLQTQLDALNTALGQRPTTGASRVTGGSLHVFTGATDPGTAAQPGDWWIGELSP